MTKSTELITCAELDAMSDTDFLSLFAGGSAFAGLIVSLGQAAPDRPACPVCGNWDIDCVCADQKERAS
jgi:hypothetical protein